MRSLFDWRRRAPDPAPPETLDASQQQVSRARVERSIAEREAASRRITGRSWRDAYDRGRRDERARHGGFSLVSAVVLMAAVIGGGAIFLAAREGSFAAGGQLVDHQLTTAADKAGTPLRGAADRAGNALENAGQNLKQKAGDSPAADDSQRQASNP